MAQERRFHTQFHALGQRSRDECTMIDATAAHGSCALASIAPTPEKDGAQAVEVHALICALDNPVEAMRGQRGALDLYIPTVIGSINSQRVIDRDAGPS
jgi:hypothetical protein